MFIFSNLATSLDGKIAPRNRQLALLGTPEDRRQMQVLRKRSDAILMGANTLRCFKKPCSVFKSKSQPMNIVMSSTLSGISPDWPFFKKKDLHRILFVGPETQVKKIRQFERSSEVIVLKKSSPRNPSVRQVIQALETRGIERLLIEGGGGVMWDFVEFNLIDEYHVTLTPKIIGGQSAPTLVDGAGFLSQYILQLKLHQHRVVGDEIYLTYKRF